MPVYDKHGKRHSIELKHGSMNTIHSCLDSCQITQLNQEIFSYVNKNNPIESSLLAAKLKQTFSFLDTIETSHLGNYILFVLDKLHPANWSITESNNSGSRYTMKV